MRPDIRIAVTGKQGQVVCALLERAPSAGVEALALGRPEYDLTEPAGLVKALEAMHPDVVINAAAYTKVDKAETEPDLAFRINAEAAGAVAEAAAKIGAPMLQISTDYVFDGASTRPYLEDDTVGPTGVYGASKLEGERAVARAHPRSVILRTSWVYAPFGENFVRTMLRLGESRDRLRVVADQQGCPTYALDIADALFAIARRVAQSPDDKDLFGVFHMSGGEATTWAEFAAAIFAEAARHGRKVVEVEPISTLEYPTPARRPANSRLDTSKLGRIYGVRLPGWRASLRPCLSRLLTP